MYDSTTAPATIRATQIGQPSRACTMPASRARLTPAMSSWATAKLIALTRWAPVPNRLNMNSGTERTFEP